LESGEVARYSRPGGASVGGKEEDVGRRTSRYIDKHEQFGVDI
jgi:hypothetical protein